MKILIATTLLAAGPALWALGQEEDARFADFSKDRVESVVKESLQPEGTPGEGEAPSNADGARQRTLPNHSKARVEDAIENALAGSSEPQPAAGLRSSFRSKFAVEEVVKLALGRSSGLGPDELPPLEESVKPGEVRWHGSFEKALAAAGVSGKPVMLFQLLGRLDEGFC